MAMALAWPSQAANQAENGAIPASDSAPHAPITVPFYTTKAGYVTLVIEDSAGHRVRNLLAGEFYPAGHHVVWWDGTDDLLRDNDAAEHGFYHIPAELVSAGTYRARGLVRGDIGLRYEMSVYNSGTPPWETKDGSGGWLADHNPPSSVLFMPAAKSPTQQPAILVGSYALETGHGLAWLDLNGKKTKGIRWLGGDWIGASFLASDQGAGRDPRAYAYAATYFKDQLFLTALTASGNQPAISPPLDIKSGDAKGATGVLRGFAVHDGIAGLSLVPDHVLFVDTKANKPLGSLPLADPRGLAFDRDGSLLVLSGKQLLRCDVDLHPANAAGDVASEFPAHCAPLIVDRLEDPQSIALDGNGDIYVADWGQSHQVKVFNADGSEARIIGHRGPPQAGTYDPNHMNHPLGLTIDDHHRLWVAEYDFQPKRVSVWTENGRLWKALYGPPQYGGGGSLDPADKTRFYYSGMEFKLDWDKAASRPIEVFCRVGTACIMRPYVGDASDTETMPETPIRRQGHLYLTNAFNSSPTSGADAATIWIMRADKAVPVAAAGRLSAWPWLNIDDIEKRLPPGSTIDTTKPDWRRKIMFVWWDRNGDGLVQPDELQLSPAAAMGFTVMPDLSIVVAYVNGRAIRYRPQAFTKDAVPVYRMNAGETIAAGARPITTSGGGQALVSREGWTILTIAPKPFAPESLGGVFRGEPMWSYPSPWPGLHPSHTAPVADRPGELIGTTRLLGGFVTPKTGDGGSIFAINGNMGEIYLFTYDGLFVAQLFQDIRQGRPWDMPVAQRGMPMNDVSLYEEDFWPTMTQTPDGEIYLQAGIFSNLVRVDGLGGIARIKPAAFTVTPDDLQRAVDFSRVAGDDLAIGAASKSLTVTMRKTPPSMDAGLHDWQDAAWATIDTNGARAHFAGSPKNVPYDVSAAVTVSGDKLYAAFRTGDDGLLDNADTIPIAPFATGGGLDILIGADPAANDGRVQPLPGDLRLIVFKNKGKISAMLYRAVVPGASRQTPFSSPWRTVTLDDVEDVSGSIGFSESSGNYEISVPLALLGLSPRDGMKIRADLGILRGDGDQTLQRVYWSNKATALVSDIPSEAELRPELWGHWTFQTEAGNPP
jgi:hypothetical protein